MEGVFPHERIVRILVVALTTLLRHGAVVLPHVMAFRTILQAVTFIRGMGFVIKNDVSGGILEQDANRLIRLSVRERGIAYHTHDEEGARQITDDHLLGLGFHHIAT